jgi:hypothetical protein
MGQYCCGEERASGWNTHVGAYIWGSTRGDPIASRSNFTEVRRTCRSTVLELNPRRTPLLPVEPEPAPKPSGWWRIPRQFFFTARIDFTYNNPVYQGGLDVKHIWRKLTRRGASSQSPSR